MRALSGLLRGGLTIRQALHAWPEEVSPSRRPGPALVKERLTLGYSVPDSLAALPDVAGALLGSALAIHVHAGGDVAAVLDEIAATMEEESEFQEDAKASSSGARLSGRLVAGLPLAFVPFSPAVRSFGDLAGMTLLLVGVVLAVVGLRWIGRLVPSAPAPDPTSQLCLVLAALLKGGLPLGRALTAIAAHPPSGLEEPLARAEARARIGMTWRCSLISSPQLERIGRVIERAERSGLPVAESLEQLGRTLRSERALAFKTRLRRAPVLMVVPLTCCILPSYGFLALGPFLRSVTLS